MSRRARDKFNPASRPKFPVHRTRVEDLLFGCRKPNRMRIPDDVPAVKAGHKIKFDDEQVNGQYTVTKIEKVTHGHPHQSSRNAPRQLHVQGRRVAGRWKARRPPHEKVAAAPAGALRCAPTSPAPP